MIYSIKLHVEHLGRWERTQALEFISASASINSYGLSYSPNFPLFMFFLLAPELPVRETIPYFNVSTVHFTSFAALEVLFSYFSTELYGKHLQQNSSTNEY